MSRGPGRWQRLLLAQLDDYKVVPVGAVVWEQTQGGLEPT